MISNILKKDIEEGLGQLEIFLNNSFALINLDANGIIQFVTPLFCEILKYNPDELIGKFYADVFFADASNAKMRNKSLDSFKNTIKSGNDSAVVREIKDKNGKTHWLKIFIRPFKNKNAKVQTVSLIVTEIKYKRVKRKARTEAALYRIIEITNQKLSTKKMLEESLDVLLALPWLKMKGEGGFMLKEEDKQSLKMIAHKGLGQSQVKMCDLVGFGVCLCGIAAEQQKFIHAPCLNDIHENQAEGMTPHGNYNVPILWENKTLGVLFLYLEEGYTKKKRDEKFLKAVTKTIAVALYRKGIEKKRKKYLRTQQSQAVLYQIIEITNKFSEEEEMLNDCLEVLLNVDWLKIKSKGSVFLENNQNQQLELITSKGLDTELLEKCSQPPHGVCLCEVAVKEQRFVYAENCTDSRHYNSDEGENQRHGHYFVPILWRAEVLGVLVLYLEHGHQKDEFEQDFLIRVSKVIGAAIFRKRVRRIKDKQAKEIMALNFELRDAKEASEEQNSELNALLENATLHHTLLQVQTDQLDKKQNDVIASITYAKRIQSALLPKKSDFSKLFKDSFIFDKPRDIVGGDFYWFTEKENLTFIILGDCTGHGVPGAFMTVVANSIINDVMEERGFEIPYQILDNLNKGIIKTLNQEKTKNNDGMDLSLVVLDKINRQVYFAGAKSPMVYLTPQGKLTEIKGSRKSIGGIQFKRQEDYKMSIIDLEEGMWIYLFSDGYRDQFGGENTKFGKKQFLELLQSMHGINGQEQHHRLESVLAEWSGNQRQIDDILCLGFKL